MRTARPGVARTAMRTNRGLGRLDSLTSASAYRRIEPTQRRLHSSSQTMTSRQPIKLEPVTRGNLVV